MAKKRKGRYEYVGGFIMMDKGDGRAEEYDRIREKTGVSPDETWSLDVSLAHFMAPRLKAFRQYANGYPAAHFKDMKAWLRAVRKMERAFRLIIQEGDGKVLDEKRRKQEERGLDLFGKYLCSLWW